MVLKRLVVSVVVLFMARPVLAEGGAESGPVVGVRVRVTTTSERLVGKWIAGDGNKLRIEVKPGKEVAIRLSEVTTLEESRRKGRRGAGAMLGFAVGAAAGAVHAARSRAPVCGHNGDVTFCAASNNDTVETGGVLLLGGLGALLGAAIAPGEKWVPIADPHVRVGVVPVRGRGISVGVAVAF